MSDVTFPEGFRIEPLQRRHPRQRFRSGNTAVDDWLTTKAFQHQQKRLSVTRVLVADEKCIAGYYTVATGQVDFNDLPPDISKTLPRRMLPVAVLAWLGVDESQRGQGLGTRLLAHALRECHAASTTFPFVAILLDALDDNSKRFYERFNFRAVPGHPYRLFLSARQLEAMAT